MAAVSCPEIRSAAYRIVVGACPVLAESRLAAFSAPAFRFAAVLVGLMVGTLAAAAGLFAGLLKELEVVVLAEAEVSVGAAGGRLVPWRAQSRCPCLRHRDPHSGHGPRYRF